MYTDSFEREYSDAATQMSQRNTPLSNVSESYCSDYGMPAYMQNKNAYGNPATVQRQNSFNLSRGIPADFRPPQPSGEKWQVRKVDPNQWRSTNIDGAYGSLYSMKAETVAERGELPETPSKHRREEQDEFLTGVDQQHKREKSYIRRSTGNSTLPALVEQRRFSEHIMQGYNKPKRREVPAYGAPKDQKLLERINSITDVVEMVVRPPSSYNVMPKRQKPAKCDRPSIVACEFCDVLGPLSCNQCIESTNRRIAHDVEQAAFPEVDCTATSLVAPSLAQIMSKGDKVVGKKRVHHGRVDTIIEPAVDKNKTLLKLPPINTTSSVSNKGKLAKALTPRAFGRPGIERAWRKRAEGLNNVAPYPDKLQSTAALPQIKGLKHKGTYHRVKRNIAGA